MLSSHTSQVVAVQDAEICNILVGIWFNLPGLQLCNPNCVLTLS